MEVKIVENKCMMKKLLKTFILVFIAQYGFAQYQIGLIPRVSPDKAVYQKIGYTEVEISYGSPAVKSREIWGELVPFDNVWRAGANDATRVEFSSEVLINNVPLDSGKYALFIIPKENDKWSVVFSKTHDQWGAFNYNKDDDAVRIDIVPRRNRYHTENLAYSIHQTGYNYGEIVLNWEYIEINIPFETNYLSSFAREVELRAEKQPRYMKWIVYLQGAEYLNQRKSNLDLAMNWINQAENIMNSNSDWNKQFYPRDYVEGHLYWVKSKLLAKNNDIKAAIEYAEKLKTMENTMYYDRKNEQESIDELLKHWRKKE